MSFERGGDPSHGGRVGEDRAVVEQVPLRGPADAAGVEDAGVSGRVVGVVLSKGEQARALEEEGPFLVEEGLEGSQVHDGRIYLHLAEIGVEGRVEHEIPARTHAEIGATAAEVVAAVAEGIAVLGVGVFSAPGHIGRHLDVARGGQAGEPGQPPEPGDARMLGLGDEGEDVLFAAALDEADELHAPGVAAAIEAELGQGIRISAVQPTSSCRTAAAQTGSGE